MLEIVERSGDGRALRIVASGTLSHEDYAALVPLLDEAVARHRRISILADLRELEGVGPRAALDDLVFDIRHINDFDRLAVVGGDSWQEWMTRLATHLTPAAMRYFDAAHVEAAWAWTKRGDGA